MKKKTFEDKIREVIKEHEKKEKVNIVEVNVFKTRKIGFSNESELRVNYYTND